MTLTINTNVRVLVVDDSAIVRKILSQELGRRSGIEIVGTAPDPYIARDKIVALNPDVLTLDVEMPRMDGDHVVSGRVLIAPGGLHMLLQRSGANYFVSLRDGPGVCRQKPSVEVLFKSVARYAGANAVGAILTGMGDDGATGLLKMRQAGAHTVAQDEPSCVVFGMPKEAIARGAAEKIVPLNRVAEVLIQYARG